MPSPYKDIKMKQFQADIPRLVVDFPYMDKERARRVEFTPEYLLREHLGIEEREDGDVASK